MGEDLLVAKQTTWKPLNPRSWKSTSSQVGYLETSQPHDLEDAPVSNEPT